MSENQSQTKPKIVTAAFIIIGNEILSGRTKDANLGFLAKELVEAGIRLMEARVIPDDEDEISNTVRMLRTRRDHIFTSGGIGPTHDDITCDSVAKSFGLDVHYHPEAVRRMEAHASSVGVELNEARMRMARTPVGATLIVNPVSAAPGFTIENVHVMAGVPRVFRAMVKELVPTLAGGAKILSLAVRTTLGEGTLASRLRAIQEHYPKIDIGSYPYFQDGAYGTTLVMRGTELEPLKIVVDEVRQLIWDSGSEPIDIEEDE